MIRFLLRRLLFFGLTFGVVLVGSFLLMHAAPGDPFEGERTPTPEVTAERNRRYHFDKPILFNIKALREGPFTRGITETQFGYYVDGLRRGDLGPSYRYQDRSVSEVLGPAIPVSMLLGGIGLLIAVGVGLPAGILASLRPNSWLDRGAIAFSMGGIIVPNFVLGPLLVMVFVFGLHWLPPAGWNGPEYMILPAILTGLPAAAMIARLTRSGMIEELRQEYIRAARARGVPERVVVMKHALKNAISPVVSYLGPAAANILTGTVVVETIFSIPGMGRHFVEGAINRDYKLVLGAVLLYCLLLMTFNLLADIAHRLLDPRMEIA